MFVLAHLSDPHLGPLPKPQLSELAGKRGLGFLNWYRKRRTLHRGDVLDALVLDLKSFAPDHIAITGDLVNISLETEFGPARSWLDTLGAHADVSLVPGNHDVYVRAAAQLSPQHWGDYMSGDAVDSATRPETPFPFVRRRGSVALIGLSTALPTGPLMATGKLGPGQLMRFSHALAHLRREGLFRVVLIHHPPAADPANRLRRLVDASEFRRVVAEHGAELVIHGHNHTNSLNWIDGPDKRVPTLGVPSASSPPGRSQEPAGYNLYRIEGAPGAWHCEVISRGFRAPGESIAELARQKLS
jgi:3',5'-cyclic AMP phosphodiesterase CpdA